MTTRLTGRNRLFFATALVAVFMFAVLAASARAGTPTPTDYDGDGTPNASDCKPLDAFVHPGAVDKPDLNFEDTNCDSGRIDGDPSKAIFVTLGGNDGAPGTLTNPMRTINAAVTAAAAAVPKKDVYVAGGNYLESVNLASGVGIYGGYEPITGKRSAAQVTTITGAPAALASGVDHVVLQLLTLHGTQGGDGNAYGLRAVQTGAVLSKVVLTKVTATADPGAAGGTGGSGGNGFTGFGFGGGGGGGGGCGSGFLGNFGLAGGGGGLGGLGGGIFGNAGSAGGIGGTGANGPVSSVATFDQASWPRNAGTLGDQGGPGGGGGGGRGGAGATLLNNLCGGTGAPGGTGGGGGFGGGGGQAGGGSFGAYAFNSSIAAVASKLTGGAGGAGGTGGSGGFGGGPTGPGGAGTGQCQTFFITVCAANGFSGGFGGAGGRGGGGGGGVGGPSAGVYQAGPGSGYVSKSGTTQQAGGGGLGGIQGNGGASRSANGSSLATMRSGTAPATSTTDSDDDHINDSADACPDVPRFTNGATDANADGCPDRGSVADSDGDGISNQFDACPTTARGNDANGDGCPDPAPAPAPAPNPNPNPNPGPTITPQVVVTLAFGFSAGVKFTILTGLKVKNVPLGATVTVTCKGKKCPKKRFVKKNAFGSVSLKAFSKKKLRPGTKLTVLVTNNGWIGAVKILTVRKQKAPAVATKCARPGSTTAVACQQ